MERLTRENLVLIKNVYDVKKWTGADFCRELHSKKWAHLWSIMQSGDTKISGPYFGEKEVGDQGR